MIVAMRSDATQTDIERVVEKISDQGLQAVKWPGGERVAVGIASAIAPDMREPLTELLEVMSGVDHVAQVSRAYKLASREFHPVDSVVEIKGITIGAPTFTVAAGPCAIESREQLLRAAEGVKKAGAKVLRGGAYKPRTSPYAFQGLGLEGLEYLTRRPETRRASSPSLRSPTTTTPTSSHSTQISSRSAPEICRTMRSSRPSAGSTCRSSSNAARARL